MCGWERVPEGHSLSPTDYSVHAHASVVVKLVDPSGTAPESNRRRSSSSFTYVVAVCPTTDFADSAATYVACLSRHRDRLPVTSTSPRG